MQVGIVGKPSAGKSTFFKATTMTEVDIANYPFTTIKPNSGVGYVKVEDPAKNFGKVSNPRTGFVLDKYRFVPVELIDVAGLVPGAHEGKGMGNQFLDDLREADVLIHVVDASGSTNANGEPVSVGSHDPCNDVQFLETELDLWYLSILKKPWERFSRQVHQEKQKISQAIAKQFSGLKVKEKDVDHIMNTLKLDVSNLTTWTEQDLKNFAIELRKITKPIVIAANKADVSVSKQNIENMKAKFPHYTIIPCSAESELALKEAAKKDLISYIPGESSFSINNESKLNENQKKALEFMERILEQYKSTGVQDVLNTAVLKVLNYVAIFPGGVGKLEDSNGNVLPDCFLMPPGTTALDFAYRLHTDFGKNFIKAIDVKKKLPVGKDHILNDLDIIEIMSKT